MTDAEFHEAYAQHKDVLYRFARRLTGSGLAAEDLVHDCFLILWRSGTKYDSQRATLRSFLIGVTRNLAWKRLRKERAFDELEDEMIVSDPIDPAGRERSEMVEQAVAALPPLQREALILAEYEGMTLEEITRITGRENLRRMLAPLLDTKGTAYGTQR
ncbi:MAG: RNA polymerase sigma factor [Bryobacteraceae bacterium]